MIWVVMVEMISGLDLGVFRQNEAKRPGKPGEREKNRDESKRPKNVMVILLCLAYPVNHFDFIP